MFHGFAGIWTPIAPAGHLGTGRALAVRVAGTPVAVFRDGAGRPAGLVDRCPHRGVALSAGRVVDGCLECPYHGWRFAGTGENCHIPWNPDAKRERSAAIALPVRELGGMIWLHTGPQPAGEPVVEETLLRTDVRISGFVTTMRTHWTRVMENMLDWPHLPFVHRRTIGRDLVARARGRMEIELDERPWGFHSRIAVDGVRQPGALDYRFPNVMVLHIPAPGRTLRMHIAVVPVTDGETRLVMMTVRDFARVAVLDRLFDLGNRRIVGEDRAIVESSWPAEVPEAGAECSVRTDAPTLLFRKRYVAELRDSVAISQTSGAAPRPHAPGWRIASTVPRTSP